MYSLLAHLPLQQQQLHNTLVLTVLGRTLPFRMANDVTDVLVDLRGRQRWRERRTNERA